MRIPRLFLLTSPLLEPHALEAAHEIHRDAEGVDRRGAALETGGKVLERAVEQRRGNDGDHVSLEIGDFHSTPQAVL